MVNTNTDQGILGRQSPNNQSLVGTSRRQDDLSRTAVAHMRTTGQEIWTDSESSRTARQYRNACLQDFVAEAHRGGAELDNLSDAFIRSEQERQKESQLFLATRAQIGNLALTSLEHTLRAYMTKTSADLTAGVRDESTTPVFEGQIRAVDTTINLGMDLQMQDLRNQNNRLVLEREQRSANISLFFEMLEKNMTIKALALRMLSDAYREECELKFRTIDKAIKYVTTVQEAMEGYARIIKDQKDQDSARRSMEMQKVEAEKRAMKALDMTHEQARRADTLLNNKENHLYALKREELAMQKCRDQQEHERRTKRYFSLWGFLFG